MESREKKETEIAEENNIEEEQAVTSGESTQYDNNTDEEGPAGEPADTAAEELTEEEPEDVDLEKVRIMLVTADKIIAGDLQLPSVGVTEDPTPESLLFYALNCGNQFIALRNCSIMDKDNTEFEPEKVKFYVININIVESCRIVPKETRKTSINKQYIMNETI